MAALAMEDPAQRERIIVAIENYTSSKPRWARATTGLLFLGAGILTFTHGALVFDGASMVIGGAFIAAGGVEVQSLYSSKVP